MSSTSKTFDHPQHGSYETPEAVAGDDKLSAEEKRTILAEWKRSLEHILVNDPNAPDAGETRTKIDMAEKTIG